MFMMLRVMVALYTLWCAFDGKVYTNAGGWRQGRMIHREAEPRYFWVVVAIYGGLSLRR